MLLKQNILNNPKGRDGQLSAIKQRILHQTCQGMLLWLALETTCHAYSNQDPYQIGVADTPICLLCNNGELDMGDLKPCSSLEEVCKSGNSVVYISSLLNCIALVEVECLKLGYNKKKNVFILCFSITYFSYYITRLMIKFKIITVIIKIISD